MNLHKSRGKEGWTWACLVLPWLPPQSLASMASSCKSLRALSNTITSRRIADAARGFEKYQVPISNLVDQCHYPYFLYTPTSIFPTSSPPKQQWGEELSQTLSDSKRCPLRCIGDDILSAAILDEAGCSCFDCSEFDKVNLENQERNHAYDDELVRNIVIEEFEDGEEGCPCGKLSCDRSAYTEDGRISLFDEDCSPLFQGFNGGSLLVTECGPPCRCDLSCRNRVSQRGLAVRVSVVRHPRKGWCLHSSEQIVQGTFVCEYAGELLTTAEARKRQQHYDEAILNKCNFCSALLVIKEHLPSGQACLRVNIDATKIGNVARFINHSCDGGNLLPTLIRSSGSVLPRLCFFASRDISQGEELTFSYGVVGESSKKLSCFCNTSACCGMLPSEPT